MEWSLVSADFERGEGLRDIYVLDASLEDWQSLIDALKREVSEMEYRVGGEARELPNDVSELFDVGPDDVTSCLYVPFGRSTLNCHFFCDDEIEFDLDPRNMTPELLPPLLDFMMLVGKATGKPVSLTLENTPEAEILRFEPSQTEVAYVGPPSFK